VNIAPGDARAVLQSLYKGVDGFEISRAEEQRVRASRSSATYGEIMPASTFRLLEELELGDRDVFYDLGCGVGKVVVAAALATCARRCVGIELAAGRLACARAIATRAAREGHFARRRVLLRHADIARSSLDDATVLYTCSTAFPTPFTRALMRRVAAIGRPVTFVSAQVLDAHPAFRLQRTLRLDMSWKRGTKVYVYRVHAP
jgi:SAM-dependent methyltransferase